MSVVGILVHLINTSEKGIFSQMVPTYPILNPLELSRVPLILAITIIFQEHNRKVWRASLRVLGRAWWDSWLSLLEGFWTALQWHWMELKGEVYHMLHQLLKSFNPLSSITWIFQFSIICTISVTLYLFKIFPITSVQPATEYTQSTESYFNCWCWSSGL